MGGSPLTYFRCIVEQISFQVQQACHFGLIWDICTRYPGHLSLPYLLFLPYIIWLVYNDHHCCLDTTITAWLLMYSIHWKTCWLLLVLHSRYGSPFVVCIHMGVLYKLDHLMIVGVYLGGSLCFLFSLFSLLNGTILDWVMGGVGYKELESTLPELPDT